MTTPRYKNTDARSVYTFTYRMLRCEDVDTLSCEIPAFALSSWFERHNGRRWMMARGLQYMDSVERAALQSYQDRPPYINCP